MARYAAHDKGRIVLVASGQPEGGGVLVPSELDRVTNLELMSDYVIRHGVIQPKETMARVAFVSVFGVPCGISTYSEWLWAELKTKVEGRVFAEREEGAVDYPDVVRCWKRGEPLTELVAEINAYDPDVVIVQHEYGHYPDARHWLAFMGAMSHRRVIVALHSVYAAHADKNIIESSIPEIVVHTEGAQRVLKNVKQVGGEVTVIPHGCILPSDQSRLWNMYRSQHTIVQFGFGGAYKGWDNALYTVAALKPDFPDIFYTGLVSERYPGIHLTQVNQLNDLAVRLGITENVGLIRGFQSDTSLNAYLRTNRMALFPYRDNGEHTVHGASGAARVAMTAGIPVVTADVPLFEGLEGVVARPNTVDGWAEAVTTAFKNPAEQVARQNEYLQANSWAVTAQRYLDLL